LSIVFELRLVFSYQRRLLTHPALNAYHILPFDNWVSGHRGREIVLYLGRRVCGMKLAELEAAVGLRNYAVVATGVKRYEQWLQTNATEQATMKRIARLLNCKM